MAKIQFAVIAQQIEAKIGLITGVLFSIGALVSGFSYYSLFIFLITALFAASFAYGRSPNT